MDSVQKSPWFILALGVLGLTVGYTVVIVSGDTAFASARSCPFKDKGAVTCTGPDCHKDGACEKGECGTTCPGCNKHD